MAEVIVSCEVWKAHLARDKWALDPEPESKYMGNTILPHAEGIQRMGMARWQQTHLTPTWLFSHPHSLMLYWRWNPGPEACKANTLPPSCAPGHTHVLYLSLPTFFGWGHYLVPLVKNRSKDQNLMPPSWCLVKLWLHPRPKPNRDSRTALFSDPQPRTTATPVKKRLLSNYIGAILTSTHRQAKHSSELNHLSTHHKDGSLEGCRSQDTDSLRILSLTPPHP